jgi:hypothetical protein
VAQLIQNGASAASQVVLSVLAEIAYYLLLIPLAAIRHALRSLDWWLVAAAVITVLISPMATQEDGERMISGAPIEDEMRYELVQDVRRWGKFVILEPKRASTDE